MGLVQDIIIATVSPNQSDLLKKFVPFVQQLYEDPHGNHVLSKLVEVMPSATLGPIIEQLHGTAVQVAKHRYGCRVLERLIEHCSETQLSVLMEEVVAESEPL